MINLNSARTGEHSNSVGLVFQLIQTIAALGEKQSDIQIKKMLKSLFLGDIKNSLGPGFEDIKPDNQMGKT